MRLLMHQLKINYCTLVYPNSIAFLRRETARIINIIVRARPPHHPSHSRIGIFHHRLRGSVSNASVICQHHNAKILLRRTYSTYHRYYIRNLRAGHGSEAVTCQGQIFGFGTFTVDDGQTQNVKKYCTGTVRKYSYSFVQYVRTRILTVDGTRSEDLSSWSQRSIRRVQRPLIRYSHRE